MREADVVVVGGGVTGVAVLRDLALRGLDALLVERSDLGTGTSGRWHGLLHSGARYAVKDRASAQECIQESTVLRRVASHAVEDLGGLFVLLPGDDEDYAERFVAGCEASGIPVEALDAAEARRREPGLAPGVRAAFAVPDAGIDSWALLRAMAADATARGARVLTRHPLVGFERDGDRLRAVRARDLASGEEVSIGCQWVVNAAGAWAGEVGRLAGVPITMVPGKGTMVVMASRHVRGVVNACRAPADGDIVVPQHEVAVLGTTSVAASDPDDIEVDLAEVDQMIDLCARMVPSLASARVLRAFTGARPLYKPGEDRPGGEATREISRTFTVLDHAERDGVANLLSIVGGKLTTCRLMAEAVVDRLTGRMGVDAPCRTASEPLPGSEHGHHLLAAPLATVERDEAYGDLVCECELITVGQVRAAVDAMAGAPAPAGATPGGQAASGEGSTAGPATGAFELEDLRRRLRLGFGPCQAAFCAWRAAGVLAERRPDGGEPLAGLARFLEERWRGQRPTIWGDQARQALLNHAIYRGIFDLEPAAEPDEAVALGGGG